MAALVFVETFGYWCSFKKGSYQGMALAVPVAALYNLRLKPLCPALHLGERILGIRACAACLKACPDTNPQTALLPNRRRLAADSQTLLIFLLAALNHPNARGLKTQP
jgi:hypothetical protein